MNSLLCGTNGKNKLADKAACLAGGAE